MRSDSESTDLSKNRSAVLLIIHYFLLLAGTQKIVIIKFELQSIEFRKHINKLK